MSDGAIRGFWTWWSEARERVEEAVRSGKWDELAPQINGRIAAIDSRLEWELCAGSQAEHALCVSAGGDPALRNVAERWLRSGPPADAAWEFHAARLAGWQEGRKLGIEGHDLALDDVRFACDVDESHERVHVRVHHPAMSDMADELRVTVAFLTLDGLLGEDGVERWIGSVEPSVDAAGAELEAAAVRRVVDELAARATGERYAVLEGRDPDGNPIFVSVNLAVKRIDHPLCDLHARVVATLRDPTPEGLTKRDEATELDRLEDELTAALGEGAVYVGRETGRGQRTWHFYVRERASAEAAVARVRGRHELALEVQPDPSWERTTAIRNP